MTWFMKFSQLLFLNNVRVNAVSTNFNECLSRLVLDVELSTTLLLIMGCSYALVNDVFYQILWAVVYVPQMKI
jgi:hypothetical protein